MPNTVTDLTPSALRAFKFQSRTRVVQGAGGLEHVGELARELGAKRALLVTDAGIVAAGHAARAEERLVTAGLRVTLFDRVKQNPTTRCVDDCVAVAKKTGVDLLIGLGGGSAMDTAKGCNFVLTNGGRIQDYQGAGKATKPMLPFIAIPTTAGTGSELQSAALIADEQTHQKMACLDPKCVATIAILDPVLTLSQPPRVAACTGMDAIAHALETAVTKKRNDVSQRLSNEAFRLCVSAFPEVLTHPENLDGRARMQLGAALAGGAIEHSMLGAAHAAANPLTAHFDLVHGQAVGMMLPHVVRFNGQDPVAKAAYEELADGAQLTSAGISRFDALVERIEMMLTLAAFPRSLAACGVERAAIPLLADEASRQWTAAFNPRPVAKEDFVKLYDEALE
jgi:alcohol dehydrogenase class IV